jgi:hypothetical protein
MNMKKCLPIVLSALMLASCVSLKEINGFAKSSGATLQTVTDSKYSFTSSYINGQTVEPFFKLDLDEINRNRFSLPAVTFDTAAMKVNKDADGTILLFVNALQSYLGGLTKLSGEDLVNYDFTSVGESLKGNQAALQKANVTGDDIDAALKIAKVATDAIMGRYREKKLRSVIIGYDAAFQRTAERLFGTLRILHHTLGSDSGILVNNYRLLLANEKLPMANKLQWRKDYLTAMNDLQKQGIAITKMMDAVQKIKTGHGELAAGLATAKLNSKAIIALLKVHAGEIRSAYSSIKQLIK